MTQHPEPGGSMPAGWYDDGSGTLRWWDGAQWTQLAQGGGMPSGQQSKSRAPLIAGIVAVVVLAVGGVLLWLFVFSSGEGPEPVVQKALQAKTCTEEAPYLTGQALAENLKRQRESANPSQTDDVTYVCEWHDFSYTDVEITTTEESGDTATVEVSLVEHFSGADDDVPKSTHFDITLDMVKVDGNWRIQHSQWCADGDNSKECGGSGDDSG